ncbi:MAG: dihydropyrimidinase [Chloroflexota bacterium]|nr:dihydropyrimidinase [Chloroflexota bacterium]
MGTVIRDGTIVTAAGSYAADVRIEGERVAAIGQGLEAAEGDEVVDATGYLLLPGGIDVHTHLDMPIAPDCATCDDFYTGHRAAAFGGTTTHIDFANQVRGESLRETLDKWEARAEGRAVIDYGFHVTILDPTPAVMEEMACLPEWGVNSIKLFLAYKARDMMLDNEAFFRLCRQAREVGLLPLVHAETGEIVDLLEREAIAAGRTEPRWHAVVHPALAEAEATNRAIALARMAGSALYVVHVTCEGAVEAIRRARAEGGPIYGETCPQYLFFTADDLDRPGFEGAKYVCSPPLRTEADQVALWSALADDTLQAISTDHAPFRFADQKQRGLERFDQIPNGVPAIEHRLTLLWHFGVNQGRLTPERFVALTATNPARLFGLHPRKGALLPGADADILLWDPEMPWTISAETHQMAVDYDLWEGVSGHGRPVKVWRRGTLLVDGDQWLGEAGSGKLVERRAGSGTV